MAENLQFTVSKVRHIEQRSRENGSNAVYKVGVRQAVVACLCGHVWNADERNGLRNVGGGAHVTCPSCKQSEHVHARLLGF